VGCLTWVNASSWFPPKFPSAHARGRQSTLFVESASRSAQYTTGQVGDMNTLRGTSRPPFTQYRDCLTVTPMLEQCRVWSESELNIHESNPQLSPVATRPVCLCVCVYGLVHRVDVDKAILGATLVRRVVVRCTRPQWLSPPRPRHYLVGGGVV